MRRLVFLGMALVLPLGPAWAQFAVDPSVGIWVNPAELSRLPLSGDAWDDLLAAAQAGCGTPDLFDMGDDGDACVLAQAIASVRLAQADPGDPQAQLLRNKVRLGLARMMDEGNWCENDLCPPCEGVPGSGCARRTLALGRNLAPYIAAADLIGLDEQDVPSRSELIAWLEGTGDPADPEEIRTGILDYEWIDAGSSTNPVTRRKLRQTHDERPNNWGGHACASAAAAAIYRENAAELLQIHAVALGFLGDCTQGDCTLFEFGAEAADWTCDQTAPEYAINEGCWVDVAQGGAPNMMFFGGLQVDDMRRGGPFPAGCDASPRACVADVHIWEGLQGRIACAHILRRQGLDLFQAANSALYRSYQFQHRAYWLIAGVPGQPHPPHISQDGSSNDDTFLAYIINHAYGASFPLDPDPGGPSYREFGKGFGWTRYTLGEHPCGWLLEDLDFDGVCEPIQNAPSLPAWGLPLAGVLLVCAAGPWLGRRRRAQAR